MQIGILKESNDDRVALTPESAIKFIKDGHEVALEKGAGQKAHYLDAVYEEAGVSFKSREELISQSDVLVFVNPPAVEELGKMKAKAWAVGMFNPLMEKERTEQVRNLDILAFSMELIPRTTIAQSMDVLSSMASIAGYKAVLMGADHLPGYMPMLMTAAGTIPPAKVLILGAGVAGLQAIATARRLGATVEAFDVRSAVKEEVLSLGAKFVEVEGATEDEGAGGYAVEQTEEYKQRQAALIQEKASKADIVITTANIPGRKAPILIQKETLKLMKSGSVIVDLAAATGGNCEGTENDKIVVKEGVTIIGDSNLPSRLSNHSSKLYGNNVYNFLKYVIKESEEGVNFEDEIIGATCLQAEKATA
jgi:NAD(P) transhydrogenase subunit alpha